MMLKTIEIPGVGPYVCGRVKSDGNSFPSFSACNSELLVPKTFNDVDAIRAAAKSMNPIYIAVENMLGNDRFGNCTCCAALKIQAILDCATGHWWRQPTLENALWLYSQVSDFNPATGKPDNGADLQTVLTFWQNKGLYQDGHGKIKTAYAVNGANKAEVIAALDANGVIYAGCDLPPAWEKITGTGFTWPMDGPPDPNAGHCTYFYGHNETGVFDGTWGMEGTIPWDAVAYYFGSSTGELYTVVAA